MRSFVDVSPTSHFPIETLPYGIFRPPRGTARVGVAIGDFVLDLGLLEELGYFGELGETQLFASDSLNGFMSSGRDTWRKARGLIQKLLGDETTTLRDNAELRSRVLQRHRDVVMQLPARIGNYTDFYSSFHHAHNV